MKGTIPKRIASHQLACRTCKHFRDDDPDIFYCQIDKQEFPGLCEEYESGRGERTFYIGVDPL